MKRILSFLRLIDEHDGNVSLTNVALMVALVKLAIVPELGAMDLGVLITALLSYQGKKLINASAGQTDITGDITSLKEATEANRVASQELGELLSKRIDEMSAKVNAASMAMGIKDLRR